MGLPSKKLVASYDLLRHTGNGHKVYKVSVARSPEQYTYNDNCRIYNLDKDVKRIVEKSVDKLVEEGYEKDITDGVYKLLKGYSIYIYRKYKVYRAYSTGDKDRVALETEYEIATQPEDCETTDVDRLESEHGAVEVNVDINYSDRTVEQMVKTYIGREYKFCFKKGRLIVPKEAITIGSYLKQSIKAWQESHANKRTKLETKMIRENIASKKSKASEVLSSVEDAMIRKIPAKYTDYYTHRLTLEYSGNAGVTRQFVFGSIFKGKSKDEILQLTEEDMVNFWCDYWKGELKRMADGIEVYRNEELNKNKGGV